MSTALQGGSMSQENPEMVPVPIPTEVPEPPRLDQIPLDILHSATVELLIQQNEDLSSRLKVNIRRNSQLELKILEHEREIKDLNRKRENVLAQIDIIKEKEALWRSQKEEKDRRMASLEKESELMESRYTELYTTSQQKQKNSQTALAKKQQEIRGLQRKLEILLKVRSRAKEKLRTFLVDLADGFNRSQKSVQKSESSRRLMTRNFKQLKDEVLEKEQVFKTQLEEFKIASQRALQDLDLKLNQANEKNTGLKREKEDLKSEIEDLRFKLHAEKKNRQKISQLTEDLTKLKNERIGFKRDFDDKAEKIEAARLLEMEKAKKANREVSELEKQLAEQKKVLATCEDQLLKFSKENREIGDQLSAIQKLWVEAQDKLEKMELRCESLEKINRQLSQQGQKEKIERATKRAQEPLTIEVKENKTPEKNTDEFQSKIKDVFASQYKTIPRNDIEL